MRGVKLGAGEESSELHFDVDVKLEEKERRNGMLVVGYLLTVGTKPSVVKFEVDGLATLEGTNQDIEKMLEVNPETKIPLILHRVYQQVFMSTFLLATVLGTPYPPPDLLFSSEIRRPGLEKPIELVKKEEKELLELKKKAESVAKKTGEK